MHRYSGPIPGDVFLIACRAVDRMIHDLVLRYPRFVCVREMILPAGRLLPSGLSLLVPFLLSKGSWAPIFRPGANLSTILLINIIHLKSRWISSPFGGIRGMPTHGFILAVSLIRGRVCTGGARIILTRAPSLDPDKGMTIDHSISCARIKRKAVARAVKDNSTNGIGF